MSDVSPVSSSGSSAPDWDLEQLQVILDEPTSWQLVLAGPGAGKSTVACQRIAYLVDEGISPSRILLVSFTRTAVAELRDRIVLYAVAGERARSVCISTIDSQAWSLRAGVDDEPISRALGDDSYDLSIARAAELFRQKQPDLCDFMSRLEHLLIDEAQDVMGVRAELVLELLRSLSDTCGVTILADPAQAIYGFTTDARDQLSGETSLLSRLETESPRKLIRRELKQIHRIENGSLVDLFVRTRKEIELADTPKGHVSRVQEVIRETSEKDFGVVGYSSIADFLAKIGEASMLVLFRRRADVLFASSYCSQAGVLHRLRMSDLPLVIRPWIGWVFAEYSEAFITQERFTDLWESRRVDLDEPLAGEDRSACWALLHRLAAARRSGSVDLVQLRRLVARSRPPVEICYPDVGTTGPILGTIHSSKGREADTVVLVMPPSSEPGDGDLFADGAMEFEEGRVYYVGATRARKMLIAAGSNAARVGYLDSGRVFRKLGESRAQLEIGRDGDVDRVAHLAWSNCIEVQRALASCCSSVGAIRALSSPENDYATRIILEQEGSDGVTRFIEVGQMSASFRSDVGKLWSLVDTDKKLKPASEVRHLYLVAVTTVALSETELGSAKPPFNRSGFALAPVIKGFPVIPFFHRKSRSSWRYK